LRAFAVADPSLLRSLPLRPPPTRLPPPVSDRRPNKRQYAPGHFAPPSPLALPYGSLVFTPTPSSASPYLHLFLPFLMGYFSLSRQSHTLLFAHTPLCGLFLLRRDTSFLLPCRLRAVPDHVCGTFSLPLRDTICLSLITALSCLVMGNFFQFALSELCIAFFVAMIRWYLHLKSRFDACREVFPITRFLPAVHLPL